MASWRDGSRLWVWLARLSAQTRTRRRVIVLLACLAVVVLVLGVWGWLIFASTRPDVDIGLVTALYRAVGFFAGEAAEPYDVPWQLQAARLIALGLVVPGGLFVAFARFAKKSFMERGARHASGHVVVVGDGRAPEAALAARGRPVDDGVVVHIGEVTDVRSDAPDGWLASLRDADGPDRIIVQDDLGDASWVEKSNAAAAKLVVISGGPDRRTIRLAQELLEAGQYDGAHLVVNLNRWGTAQWFDLHLARDLPRSDHPYASVEVGCVAEAMIVDRVVEALGRGGAGGADGERCATGRVRANLALAGEGEVREVLIRLLVRDLYDEYSTTYARNPKTLHIVDLDDRDDRTGPEGTTSPHPVETKAIHLGRSDSQLAALSDALVFVIDDDPDRFAQLEFQLLTRFAPGIDVVGLDPVSLEGDEIREVRTDEAKHILRGPAWRLGTVLLPTDEAPDAEALVDPARIRRTRRVMAELGNANHRIVALPGPPGGEIDELSSAAAAEVAACFQKLDLSLTPSGPMTSAAARNLRWKLLQAGYDFDEPAVHAT